jgi:hypothetical protein
MNSRILFTYFFLIASLWSCDKENQERKVTCVQQDEYDYLDGYQPDSLCTSEICTSYLNLWEEIFKETNNLSDTFFDEHIILCTSSLNTWNEGISFMVCYQIKMDWAIAWNCDKLAIKIFGNSNLYPELPRDEYLSNDEIRFAIEQNRRYSRIGSVSNSNIIFLSMSDALNQLIEEAKVNTLCMRRITLNKTTGSLLLTAWAEYENEENSCIKGVIDLNTGNTEVTDTPCMIIN